MSIKIETMVVTPQIASEMLKQNTINRVIRRSVVEGLKLAFSRGEYTMTHQGISFDEDGNLADGQHRLTAISEMRDGAFPFFVCYGLDRDAFKNIDVGVKRSAADALSEDKRLVETARIIALACSVGSKGSPSNALLSLYIDAIRDDHDALMSAYGSATKTWTSAPVRVAAIVSMRRGIPGDYVKSIYRQLARQDLDAMPSVARSLCKAVYSGAASASDRADMISRCLVVFDPRRANNKIIKVYSPAEVYSAIRDAFPDVIALHSVDEKKAASSAAKGISRPHYLTATR